MKSNRKGAGVGDTISLPKFPQKYLHWPKGKTKKTTSPHRKHRFQAKYDTMNKESNQALNEVLNTRSKMLVANQAEQAV